MDLIIMVRDHVVVVHPCDHSPVTKLAWSRGFKIQGRHRVFWRGHLSLCCVVGWWYLPTGRFTYLVGNYFPFDGSEGSAV